MILSMDITDRKRAEQKLSEKISELDFFLNETVNREVEMTELKREISGLKVLMNNFQKT